MKICPNCGTQNPDEFHTCNQCEEPLKEPILFKPKSNKLKIIIPLVLLGIIIIFTILILTHIICLNHKWIDATCTTPKLCHYCDKAEGEALGHTWKNATCINPKTCIVCNETTGNALEHTWTDATCTTPSTCGLCGKQNGEPLEHKIVIDNAVSPTCTDEGLTEGSHCDLCDEIITPQTTISTLEHTNGEWTITDKATLTEKGIEELLCSACGYTIDSRDINKKSPKVEQNSFNFTDEELIDWINDLSTAYVGYTDLGIFGSDNTSYRITMSDGDVGALLLNHGDNGKNGNICAIMVYFGDVNISGAMVAWIGEKIDTKFSAEAAFKNFASNKSYTSADMTTAELHLNDDFDIYILAPSEFLAEILS